MPGERERSRNTLTVYCIYSRASVWVSKSLAHTPTHVAPTSPVARPKGHHLVMRFRNKIYKDVCTSCWRPSKCMWAVCVCVCVSVCMNLCACPFVFCCYPLVTDATATTRGSSLRSRPEQVPAPFVDPTFKWHLCIRCRRLYIRFALNKYTGVWGKHEERSGSWSAGRLGYTSLGKNWISSRWVIICRRYVLVRGLLRKVTIDYIGGGCWKGVRNRIT